MSLLVFSDTFLEGIFWDFVIALLHYSHITMGFFNLSKANSVHV